MRYFVGIFLLIFAVINSKRVLRWIGDGEAYLVISAAGDGLLGKADKLDRPTAFWFNIAVNGFVAIGAALFGIAILIGFVEF